MGEQQIFNALIEFFEEDEWDFQWMTGLSALDLTFSGENGEWHCYAQAREEQQQIVFYSILPISVPQSHRARMAEFITRANYGIIIGNFEMDFDDGEIRYKTSLDVEGLEIHAMMIAQIVYANLAITDRYLPGVRRVIETDETPLAILDTIEQLEELEDMYDDAFGESDINDN